ncbi:hypothetical protein [Arthrobacter alpinus]|nr:hypothetical protein [Arthrobacter alpinus]
MKRLHEAFRRFVAKHIVAIDPRPELSFLDQDDRLAHGEYVPGGLGI